MIPPKQALEWELTYAREHRTIECYRVRDAMGRERWVEQPIDSLTTRKDVTRPAFDDQRKEIRR